MSSRRSDKCCSNVNEQIFIKSACQVNFDSRSSLFQRFRQTDKRTNGRTDGRFCRGYCALIPRCAVACKTMQTAQSRNAGDFGLFWNISFEDHINLILMRSLFLYSFLCITDSAVALLVVRPMQKSKEISKIRFLVKR